MGVLGWAKQLDDRVLGRWTWFSRPLPNWQLRLAVPWLVLGFGGLVLRLLLHGSLRTPFITLGLYAGVALLGLLLLAWGLRDARRQRDR